MTHIQTHIKNIKYSCVTRTQNVPESFIGAFDSMAAISPLPTQQKTPRTWPHSQPRGFKLNSYQD